MRDAAERKADVLDQPALDLQRRRHRHQREGIGGAVADGRIAGARLAFGGLGPMPWRDPTVEAALIGQVPGTAAFEAAADALLADARGYGANDFKIPLARRTLIATLRDLTADAA